MALGEVRLLARMALGEGLLDGFGGGLLARMALGEGWLWGRSPG